MGEILNLIGKILTGPHSLDGFIVEMPGREACCSRRTCNASSFPELMTDAEIMDAWAQKSWQTNQFNRVRLQCLLCAYYIPGLATSYLNRRRQSYGFNSRHWAS